MRASSPDRGVKMFLAKSTAEMEVGEVVAIVARILL
jgi:hypothetical protein